MAAAQALPYTAVAGTGPQPAQAHRLLWIAAGVVAAAAPAVGRPGIVLAVAAATAAQYSLIRALASAEHAGGRSPSPPHWASAPPSTC
ncbi:hypothetical protein [Kitasatospora sp. NPDC057223]|uniref:hypothetical protein n=1 Tax=Kitasatospora sp. NPDC057223 TaxID=3346055 RepID=UPI003644F703